MQKIVMILTPFYPPHVGGAETFAKELYKQVKKKHHAFVCTISWNRKWHGINWFNACEVVFDLLITAALDCFGRRPHVVHALGFNAAFVGAILKPIFKFKLIVTPLALYDFNNKLLARLVRWTLKRADIIFAESEISKDNLAQVTNRIKIKVFTHWVNQKMFFPIAKVPGKMRVLFVGRPQADKGIHIIRQVEKILKGVDFVYATNVPHEELPNYYQAADILVVPSLYAESPNLVVAEAASCGCVVVTSDCGALPEQVKDFGFSVYPSVNEFRTMINNLNNDRLWLQLLRNETITYAQKNFTERNAEEIIDEY